MARRQREFNGKTFSDDGSGKLYNAELKKYLIYRPYPLLVDEVRESDKIEPDNKQEYTSKQLKDKFGTDDTSLINAGKEKEEQVAKVEDKKSKQDEKPITNDKLNIAIDAIKSNTMKYDDMLDASYIGDKQNGYYIQFQDREKRIGDINYNDEKVESYTWARIFKDGEMLAEFEDNKYSARDKLINYLEEETIKPDKVWDDNSHKYDSLFYNEDGTKHIWVQIHEDLNNLSELEKKYDNLNNKYKKEHDPLFNYWRKQEYSSDPDSEYQKAYKKLSKVEDEYKELNNLSMRLNNAKGYKMLTETGNTPRLDENQDLLFNPIYYRKDYNRKINLGIDIHDLDAYKYENILSGIRAQMSDGIWENSSAMEKYWENMDFEQRRNRIVMSTPSSPFSNRSNNGWYDKSDNEIRDYLANKIKYIAQLNLKDYNLPGKWSKDNDTVLSYFDGNDTTVADCYKLYEILKNKRS